MYKDTWYTWNQQPQIMIYELHYTLGALVVVMCLFTTVSIARAIQTLIARAQRSLYCYLIAHFFGFGIEITGFVHFSYPDSVAFQAIRMLLVWGLFVSLWYALLFRFITIFDTIEDTKQITAYLRVVKPALYSLSFMYTVYVTTTWLVLPWTPQSLRDPRLQDSFLQMGYLGFACFLLLMLICLIISFLRLRQIMQTLINLGESKAHDIKKLQASIQTQKTANMRSFLSLSICVVFAVLASVLGFDYILVHLTMLGGTMGTFSTLKMFKGFKLSNSQQASRSKMGASKKTFSRNQPEAGSSREVDSYPVGSISGGPPTHERLAAPSAMAMRSSAEPSPLPQPSAMITVVNP